MGHPPRKPGGRRGGGGGRESPCREWCGCVDRPAGVRQRDDRGGTKAREEC